MSEVRDLRLAVPGGIFWRDLTPGIEAAVRGAVAVFERQGARIERLDFPEAERAPEINPGGLISIVEGHLALTERFDDIGQAYGATHEFRARRAREATAVDYLRALRAREELAEAAARCLADIDAVIAPTTPGPARPLAEVDRSPEGYEAWDRLYARNTRIGNLLGLAANSLPCGFTADALPIGLMPHAKAGDEATLLRLAHAFQQASEHHFRRPPGFNDRVPGRQAPVS